LPLLLTTALLTACQRPSDGPTIPSPSATPAIKPEMLVHWTAGSDVYCDSKLTLSEFFDHAARQAQTKALPMLGSERPCHLADPKGTGRVLSIDRLESGVPVAEVIPYGSGQASGFWTPQAELVLGPAP